MKVTKGRLSLPETAKCKEQIRCGSSVGLLSEESIMVQTRPTVQHELHCRILLCSILARNDEACSAGCTLDQGLQFLQILELCKHYLTLDVSIWSTVTFGSSCQALPATRVAHPAHQFINAHPILSGNFIDTLSKPFGKIPCDGVRRFGMPSKGCLL